MQEILDRQRETQAGLIKIEDTIGNFIINNPNRFGDALKPALALIAGQRAIVSAEIAQTLAMIESEQEQPEAPTWTPDGIGQFVIIDDDESEQEV